MTATDDITSPEERAAAGPMQRHTAARGETFAMVAKLYYGSSRYDMALQSFNRGLTARSDRLTAGDLIVIPRVDESSMPRKIGRAVAGSHRPTLRDAPHHRARSAG